MSPFFRSALGIVAVTSVSMSCVRPVVTTTSDARTAAPVAADETGQVEMNASAGVQWSSVTLRGFAPGMGFAVVHGNPDGTGDYTIRLRFPDGYETPPHWHPKSEHLTVLQGQLLVGMGERFDAGAMRELGPGDFIYAPPKMPHYTRARGETVIQLHGQGPFVVRLVGSAP